MNETKHSMQNYREPIAPHLSTGTAVAETAFHSNKDTSFGQSEDNLPCTPNQTAPNSIENLNN